MSNEVKSTYYVLSYYNVILQEFQAPFAVEMPPEVFAGALRRQLKIDPETAKKQHLDECRLFSIGVFEAGKGLIENNEPKELLDCLEYLPHDGK